MRNILVLVLGVTLSGCISTKFVYNRADWFATWYISSVFDLNRGQKTQLRGIVDRTFEWHRMNQLPRYAEFCRELDREAAGTVTPEMLEARYAEMIAIWDEFIRHIIPDAAEFLRALEQQQIDDFLDNIEERNEELWEEFAGSTPQERIERRTKAAVRGLQRFVGRLSREQKELVGSYIATMHDNSEEWLEGRRAWQMDFRALLAERPPEPEFTARLAKLMLDPNDQDSAEYRIKVEENRRIIFAMMTALWAGLSEKQRERFSGRLNDFADDFELLAEQT